MMRSSIIITLLLLFLLGGCAGCYKEHVVRPGQDLSVIADGYGVSQSELRRTNRLSSDYQLFEGQTLYVACRSQWREPSRPAVAKPQKSRRYKSKAKTTTGKPRKAKYNKYANQAGKVKLSWPLEGRVVRKFGEGGNATAKGIDISSATGRGVHAAQKGLVNYAGTPAAAYGPMLILDHQNGYLTVYSQLGSISVSEGGRVKKGQKLGTVGKSGYLHFEVRKGSTPVDPLLFLPAR